MREVAVVIIGVARVTRAVADVVPGPRNLEREFLDGTHDVADVVHEDQTVVHEVRDLVDEVIDVTRVLNVTLSGAIVPSHAASVGDLFAVPLLWGPPNGHLLHTRPATAGGRMAKPYYLIDFENVQPKALGLLKPGESRIKVFLGQQQTKLMLELVQALQPFGSDAEYIAINGSGPDAVDFHIAYYIGRIAAEEPGAAFHIVSKDTGFDPLVRHLGTRGIACRRLPELPGTVMAKVTQAKPVAAAPKQAAKKVAAKATKKATKTVTKKAGAAKLVVTVEPVATPSATDATTGTRAKTVLANLRKSTKPAKVAGLRSSIRSWFKLVPDDGAIDAVLHRLVASKKIAINGTSVTYALD